MPFTKLGPNLYRSPSGRRYTKKQVALYYATDGFTKERPKLAVNNKMKGALGKAEFKKNTPTGKIEINVKAHKGDKAELASTIKHEILHVKHPKMTEKEVYKRSAKTKIPPQEQTRLLRKLGVAPDFKPGELINAAQNATDSSTTTPVTTVSVMGLI